MKFRSMIWLAGAAALMLVAGNALAQDKQADAKAGTEQSQDKADKAKADARKQADEEAKARRAERKAKASRSGDDREDEEEHPAR